MRESIIPYIVVTTGAMIKSNCMRNGKAAQMPKGTFDLAGEVEKILNEYGDEVSERMVEVVEKVAQKGVKQLKATSPVDSGAPKSGK